VKDILAAQQTSGLIHAFVQQVHEAAQLQLSAEPAYEVEFDAFDGKQRLDAVVRMRGGATELLMAVEVLRHAYPRDIKRALWQLDEFSRSAGAADVMPVVPVVIGHQISPGARELLRSRHIGYFDATGSLYLKHGDMLVNIDKPAPPTQRSRPTSLFTGAREQVIHALLDARSEWLSGHELAAKAKTSTFTVSQTLRELERMEWIEAEGAGRSSRRRLSRPGAVLDAWTEAWRQRDEQKSRWFLFSPRPHAFSDTFTSKLDPSGGWSLTGASAGNSLAPLLTSVDVLDVVVPPGQSGQIVAAAGLKPADRGHNITLVERSGASLLFQQSLPNSPVPLASPFIVYLDLLKDERGRHKELAAHLRSQVLKV